MTDAKKLPDISEIRGMGKPLFFSFNIEPKSNILVSHAVVFSTLILPPDRELKLCEESDDPRMPHFLKFLVENKIMQGAKAIDEVQRHINSLREELKSLDGQLKTIKTT